MSKTFHKKTQIPNSTKAVDSVSATELLKALHTLDNINKVHQKPNYDLNISFSQKDTFDQTPQVCQQSNNLQKMQKQKKKSQTKKKEKQNEQINKSGKIDFEFYMSKKQKTKSKTPPKSSQQIYIEKRKTLQKGITQRKQPIGKALGKAQTTRISALTQRSLNSSVMLKVNNQIIINKQLRLRTEADQSYSNTKAKKPSNSKSIVVREQRRNLNKDKENKIFTINDHIISFEKENKVVKPSQPINQLSVHERNKEFIRLKNEKLAKLTQQVQDKKREQEKQCTFKPRIISNNANIKSKYNDLCASRDFYQKSHKKCRAQNENDQDGQDDQLQTCKNSKNNSKTARNPLSQHQEKKQQFSRQSTSKLAIQQCQSRLNQCKSLNDQQNTLNKQKSKYKNSKFNILLDLIH